MATFNREDLRRSLNYGVLAGIISLCLCAIGMVELFGTRELIAGGLNVGYLLVFGPTVLLGYLVAQKSARKVSSTLLSGLIVGFISAIPLVILVLLAINFDVRQFLPNVSPALIEMLTFNQESGTGILILAAAMVVSGLVGASFSLIREDIRKHILTGFAWVVVLGMLSEIGVERVRHFFGSPISKFFFRGNAMAPITAIIIFVIGAGVSWFIDQRLDTVKTRTSSMTPEQQRKLRISAYIGGLVFLLALPLLLGTYLSEVINNVGIFILMGLGLNIVVGFAGLLDLGYVAFFAIGAYMMGVLTSEGDLGLGFTFWTAVPICVGVAALFGILLGIPVLRMRGDYLAIVTLGFGEIIRILALSDLLKPYIGGAQGILKIPKPVFIGNVLVKPEMVYYIVLAGCLLVAFVAWRLSESRLGRQWMALREDEDVAEAVGIRLVNIKLLAFTFGAAFGGLAGAIFASKLTSIFPHSFNLLISINVLSIIIIGGIGSLPGVVVGALILVGLPELLREFKEFRLLMYGALLIGMMLYKPEGFWPSAVRKRELHAGEEGLHVDQELPHAPLTRE
jgi:branched-chain amino acid transport system permease protein